MESVSLIEKKIYFSLGEESTQDFHDYITDFYDDKIRQLRKELNDYMLLCSSLQEQLKDRVRANLSVVEDKTDFDFAPLEEVAALKKALAHSEKIIQQNNILIKEQSTALEEMATFVTAMEKKEKTNLAVY